MLTVHKRPAKMNDANQLKGLAVNRLICGDNLDELPKLPKEHFDLVYADPPFFSKRHYEVIWGDEAEVRSFEDRWEGGIENYIAWMRPRIQLIHDVLKPTGSFYLHCDWHAHAHLRILMDSVFGESQIQGEIIWRRTAAHVTSKRWPHLHDIILAYAKDISQVAFTVPRVKPDAGWVAREYRFTDKDGPYMVDNLTGAGTTNGPSGQPWRGIDPRKIGAGRHWRYVPETLEKLDKAGRIYWPKTGRYPKLKQYLHESEGTVVGDVWTDISVIGRTATERMGYPTQKPRALLTRIIDATTAANAWVLDPFCGCGTTLIASQIMRRNWVGIDISPTAIKVVEKQLRALKARREEDYIVTGMPKTLDALKKLKPFEFQNWVINKLGARQRRKDLGLDGEIVPSTLQPDAIGIQVKQSDNIGRNVVDNFETALRREKHTKGCIVAFSFGKGAYEEVARVKNCGEFDIRLLTVDELLRDRFSWAKDSELL